MLTEEYVCAAKAKRVKVQESLNPLDSHLINKHATSLYIMRIFKLIRLKFLIYH